MIRLYSFITCFFLMVFTINAQTILTLQPNGNSGKDAFISSNVLDAGQGNSTEFDASAWTIFGSPFTIRSLIDFDLSSLPLGATIQSAQLTLYNNPNAQNGYANGQHVHVSGSNDAVLQRIISPWTEDVAWSNQPATTSQNEVTLAQDTDPNQDYTLDVTNLLLDIIANSNSSFGFLLKLNTESPYRFLAFASSDHNSTKGKWSKDKELPISSVKYISVLGLDSLKNGEIVYANYLAAHFSGNDDNSMVSTVAIKKFEGEYGFVNKRLPVWKVQFTNDFQERYYVETSTGKLSLRVDDRDLLEGYSFSFLHKHHFMDFGGKLVRDISTMFWAAMQIVMVCFGVFLYFKFRKRKK